MILVFWCTRHTADVHTIAPSDHIAQLISSSTIFRSNRRAISRRHKLDFKPIFSLSGDRVWHTCYIVWERRKPGVLCRDHNRKRVGSGAASAGHTPGVGRRRTHGRFTWKLLLSAIFFYLNLYFISVLKKCYYFLRLTSDLTCVGRILRLDSLFNVLYDAVTEQVYVRNRDEFNTFKHDLCLMFVLYKRLRYIRAKCSPRYLHKVLIIRLAYRRRWCLTGARRCDKHRQHDTVITLISNYNMSPLRSWEDWSETLIKSLANI